MLPKQITELAEGFVRHYDAEHPATIQFRRIRNSVLGIYIKKFGGWQEGAVIEIGKELHTYINEKGRFIWDKLKEILNSTELEVYPALNSDLKSYLAIHLNPSIAGATRYLEEMRAEAHASVGITIETQQSFQNVLVGLNAEVDLFCANYSIKRKEQKASITGVRIENFTGVFGNVVDSQVTAKSGLTPLVKERKTEKWSVEKWCAVVGTILAILGFSWAIFIWYKPTPTTLGVSNNAPQLETNAGRWLPPELPYGCTNVSVSFGTMKVDLPLWVAKIPHHESNSTNFGTNVFTTQLTPNYSLSIFHAGDIPTNEEAINYLVKDLPSAFISNAANMSDYSPRKRHMSFISMFSKTPIPGGKTIDGPVWPIVVSNRLFVDVEIPFIRELHRIVMDSRIDSELANLPKRWDINYNSNRLEIVNEDTNPVLQVIYKSPTEVQVNGIYVVSKTGFYAAFNWPPFSFSTVMGMGTQPTQLMEVEDFEKTHNVSITTDSNVLYRTKFSFAKTIFKYPSWKYLGDLAP